MKLGEAKGIITTILILSGLFSLSTGAILYFLKYGMWLGLTRKFINDTHSVSGLIMGIAVIIPAETVFRITNPKIGHFYQLIYMVKY